MGAGLADLINKNSDWLTATALESPGAIPNLLVLRDQPELRKNAMVVGYAYQAMVGVTPFEEDFDELREIAGIGVSGNFFLSNNPKIRTIKDLEGKRVGFGTKPSLGLVDQPMNYLEKEGISVKAEFLGNAAADEMRDGKIDAIFNGALCASPDYTKWAPLPALAELLAMDDVNFISLNEDILHESMADVGMPLIPGAVTVPPGGFHESQTEPLVIRGEATSWVVHKDMPDEVIKEVLRIIYENADAFGDLLPAGNYICKETMTRVGSPEIMHPAAVDFYREKGLKIPVLDD